MGNRNRKRGFTLIEIVTAMLVMAVIAGAAMMSITSAKQTAKREAERVQAYIYRQMQRADRMHKDFTIQVFSDHLQVNIDSEPFKPSEGC
ncbi:MAG: type II secretion system protein, partial [Synergistaceae bacterium]|nr:type II secretion system protein [Synergistaceae bacterium]